MINVKYNTLLHVAFYKIMLCNVRFLKICISRVWSWNVFVKVSHKHQTVDDNISDVISYSFNLREYFKLHPILFCRYFLQWFDFWSNVFKKIKSYKKKHIILIIFTTLCLIKTVGRYDVGRFPTSVICFSARIKK